MKNLNMFKWRDKDGEVKKFLLKPLIFHKWRKIGDFVTPYEQLEVWSKEKDAEDCCSAVLNHWLTDPPPGHPATWEGLHELLKDSGLSTVAAQLKDALENAI